MKKFQIAVLVGILMSSSADISHGTDYVKLSGTIENLSAAKVETFISVYAKGQTSGPVIAQAEIQNNEKYSVFVPRDTALEMQFSIFDKAWGSTASWRRSDSFTKDEIVNFKIPAGIKITGRVIDGQGKPITGTTSVVLGISLSQNDTFDPMGISSDGKYWSGYSQRQITYLDAEGRFDLYSYPTKEIKYERYFGVYGGGSSPFNWISPKFLVEKEKDFLVCVPINFGDTRKLQDNCSEDQAAQSAQRTKEIQTANEVKQTALKLKFSQLNLEIDNLIKKYPSQKAELDLYKNKIALFERIDQKNTVQSAELNLAGIASKIASISATYKKIARTIICAKGTRTVKVTDVKPACPVGYKKK
jgi:hypothetical protein